MALKIRRTARAGVCVRRSTTWAETGISSARWIDWPDTAVWWRAILGLMTRPTRDRPAWLLLARVTLFITAWHEALSTCPVNTVSETGSASLSGCACVPGRYKTSTAMVSTIADSEGAPAFVPAFDIARMPGTDFFIMATRSCLVLSLNLTSGSLSTLAGSGEGRQDGVGTNAKFNFRHSGGVAVTADGITVVVADQENHRIRLINLESRSVSTLAGSSPGWEDGIGTSAKFWSPSRVALTSDGVTAVVADQESFTIRLVNLNTGEVSTLAGGNNGDSDGFGTNAGFFYPQDVCVTADDNVIVADYRHRIRKIVLSTGAVTTVAGTTTIGSQDGVGTRAGFGWIRGVAIAKNGDILVADFTNHLIRVINRISGAVSTLAGSSQGFQDGLVGKFNEPQGLASTLDGNILVADSSNYRIRLINPVHCAECPLGSFSSTSGATTCSLCLPGTFQNVTGASSCLFCRGGLYPNSRPTYLTSTLQDFQDTALKVFGVGSVRCVQDGSTCSDCSCLNTEAKPFGVSMWASGGSVGAIEWVFNVHAAVAIEFTRGDGSPWADRPVELLKNGNFLESVPFYENDGIGSRTRTVAVVAPDDVLTLVEGTDGSDCKFHIYSITISAGSTNCVDCPQGAHAGEVSIDKFDCKCVGAGLQVNETANSCVCTAGFTGPDLGPCTKCAAGKYKDVIGTLACSTCRNNTFSITEAATASETCLECQPGASSPPGSDEQSDCVCDIAVACPGQLELPPNLCGVPDCTCPPGYSLSCDSLGREYFRTQCSSWAGAREQCKAGGGDLVVILDATKNAEVISYMQSFNDYITCQGPYPWIGATGCTGSSCTWVDGSPWSYTGPGFSVDDPNLHFYTDGRWGTWGNSAEAIGICERCVGCTACNIGKYKGTWNKQECNDCDPGAFTRGNSTANEACELCPSGTYKENAGEGTCRSCPFGSHSNPGSTNDFACRCKATCKVNRVSPAGFPVFQCCIEICSAGFTRSAGGMCVRDTLTVSS